MRTAFRAKKIISLAGEPPARGIAALNAPFTIVHDAVITAHNGVIEAVEPYATFSRRPNVYAVQDMGDITLAPAFVNSHTHLELSHLAGKTTLGKGFVPWLESLVPLATAPVSPTNLTACIVAAVQSMLESGTAHVGDVGSRNPQSVAQVAQQIALSHGQQLGVTHFLEVLGFSPPTFSDETSANKSAAERSFLPEQNAKNYCSLAAREMLVLHPDSCAIAGHALYSTSEKAMQAAHRWCSQLQRTFSLHLAEHPEETDCLVRGTGALYDFFAQRILPSAWQPPKMRPVAFAHSLGLLDSRTLAVHCTQCNDDDIALLTQTKTKVCLCPRSNALIGTGSAPAQEMALRGILLCLGTDSLASNHSLSMQDEILAARSTWRFSPQAALRMATVNGAAALGLSQTLGTLEPGKLCTFSIFTD